jgi:Transcriptional regulatory protein, C terminal
LNVERVRHCRDDLSVTENLAKPHPAVHRDTRRIELSVREVMLLKVLMREPARVFTRTELCERFWEHANEYDTKLVEVFIGRLQKSRRSLVDLHRSPRWLYESFANARFEGAAKVTMALPFEYGRQPRSPRFYGYEANAQDPPPDY